MWFVESREASVAIVNYWQFLYWIVDTLLFQLEEQLLLWRRLE